MSTFIACESVTYICLFKPPFKHIKMDFLTRELAEQLCDLVGGKNSAPCFANMLQASIKLSKKRKRSTKNDEPILATRLDILSDTTEKYSTPSIEGHGRLDRFEKFLELTDKRYMSRSIGQRYIIRVTMLHSISTHTLILSYFFNQRIPYIFPVCLPSTHSR